MAHTRARVVAATPGLIGELREAIAIAIQAAGPAETIREDARAMRTRMLRDLPANGPWDVKLRPGGLVEVEFVAQVLQLIHTRTRPDLRSTTTRTALANLRDADLLSGEDAALLIRADRVWRSVQGMIRLMTGKSAREPHLTDASAEVLLRTVRALGLPAVDADDLRAMLDAVAREVRAAFVRHIGDPET